MNLVDILEPETETKTKTQERLDRINDCRTLLEYLEQNPEVKLPYELEISPEWSIYGLKKDEYLSTVKVFGTCEKKAIGSDFIVQKRFGRSALRLYTTREDICERVVVGTEDVPELVLPAVPEKVIEAHTREIVEWRCPSILAASNGNGNKSEESEKAA